MPKPSVLLLALVSVASMVSVAAADSAPADVGSETIHIDGHYRTPEPASPVKDPGILPPYSDAAISGNYWSKAWLLLDIDTTGSVRRLKFLKRPGHDLDAIAVTTALRMKFNPARDSSGAAIDSKVVYPIEWPAYWWLVNHTGFAEHYRPELGKYLQCEGGRPWNLGHVGSPTLKDCSQPDMSKATSEPWIMSTPQVAQR